MQILPIPDFKSVKEIVRSDGSIVLIVPDHMAGRRHAYNVIRLNFGNGVASRIGCELDLKFAREVASRPAAPRARTVSPFARLGT